ncbi:hypothetical protein E2562_019673 [Oryza meyeriana var. granulata]|uniref:Uncharacterized protein n=1 Tax=Oryza meyeriana var. granulata TaxID=110450 RepID=A0A6G1C8R9_9ORYZ|nr:hypothetical protein E2562_019673 [Oryza meyeriana var. granulata]
MAVAEEKGGKEGRRPWREGEWGGGGGGEPEGLRASDPMAADCGGEVQQQRRAHTGRTTVA